MYDKLDTLSPNSIQDWIVIWCDHLEKYKGLAYMGMCEANKEELA